MKLYGFDDEIMLSGCENLRAYCHVANALIIYLLELTCLTIILQIAWIDITSFPRKGLPITITEYTMLFAI